MDYVNRFYKKPQIFFLICLSLISLVAYLMDWYFTIPHGLEGKYYTNSNWQGDAQFVILDSEISTELLKDRRGRFKENRFSIEWNGFVVIEKSGIYTFATASDDGSDLYLGNQKVVDNGGSHGLREIHGQIYLEAGIHPIRIRYFQAGGYYRLDLSWASEGKSLENLSFSILLPYYVSFRNYKLIKGLDQFVILLGWVWLGTLIYFVGFYLSRRIFTYINTSGRLPLPSYETSLVALSFLFVILFFFYDIIFLDYSLLTGGPPEKPHHVIDPAASSLQHEPYTQFASKMYKKGLVPLWNPHAALGAPLNAHMHTAVFFPLNFLLFLNPSPEMWDFVMILRILLAGVLAYFFFRHFLELEKFSAFVGAAAFMFSGHLILNLNMVYINAVVLLPGLLYTSEILLKTPNLKTLSLLAAMVGLNIVGGMPEATFFAFFYTSVYYLFRCITGVRSQESGVRSYRTFSSQPFGWVQDRLLNSSSWLFIPGLWFAGAVLLGFLLSGIALLPFLEFVKIGDVGIHDADKFRVGLLGVSPYRIFDLWVPYFSGPINNAWNGENWQYLPGYIGIVVALLVVASLLQGFAFRGKAFFFTGMVFFFLVKAYGLSTLFNDFIGNLLAFRVTHFPRYFPGEFMFSTAALVGVFTQTLLQGRVRKRYLGFSVILGIASIGLLLGLHYDGLLKHNKLDYALLQIRTPIIFCLLIGIGVGLHYKKWISSKIFAFCLVILLILELFIWMPKIHHKRSNLVQYGDPPPHIKFIKEDPGVFRVYGLDSFLFPSVPSGYGLDDFGSVDALFNSRYLDFSQKLIRSYNGYFNGFSVPNVENRFFSLLNLKYVVTSLWTQAPAPFFTHIYQQEGNIYRNENVFPRAFIVHRAEVAPDPEMAVQRLKDESFDLRRQIILENAEDLPIIPLSNGLYTITTCNESEQPCISMEDSSKAEITSYTPDKVIVKVNTEQKGFLVLSDAYFPGWKAFVDGKEQKIYLTNYLIRSVFVDQGTHTVEFVYQPISYKLGAWLTLMGCGVIAALCSIFISKRGISRTHFLNKP